MGWVLVDHSLLPMLTARGDDGVESIQRQFPSGWLAEATCRVADTMPSIQRSWLPQSQCEHLGTMRVSASPAWDRWRSLTMPTSSQPPAGDSLASDSQRYLTLVAVDGRDVAVQREVATGWSVTWRACSGTNAVEALAPRPPNLDPVRSSSLQEKQDKGQQILRRDEHMPTLARREIPRCERDEIDGSALQPSLKRRPWTSRLVTSGFQPSTSASGTRAPPAASPPQRQPVPAARFKAPWSAIHNSAHFPRHWTPSCRPSTLSLLSDPYWLSTEPLSTSPP